MDITREQQPSQHPSSPEAAPGAPPPSLQPLEAPPPPSAFYVAQRLARLLLRRLLLLADQGWQLLLPRLGWVLLTTFLLGIIGILSAALVLPRLVRSEPVDSRAALIEPADAVEDFLRGQQTYDADLMWESLSPDLRSSLEAQAITRDALAEQIESERQAGQRYRNFEYVGGISLDSRQTMYFYAVAIESPAPERNGTFSFVFTVDRDGKIIGLRM